MEALYETIKRDVTAFVRDLNTQKVISYSRGFGKIIGLRTSSEGKVYVTPQYVLASQCLFPYFTGRIALFASTFAFICSSQSNNENQQNEN